MLSQTRKGKRIIKGKKKKSCETCYTLEVLRGKPKMLTGSIVLQEKTKQQGEWKEHYQGFLSLPALHALCYL